MKKLLTILLSIIIAMAGYSQSPTKGALNTVDTTWKPTIKMLAINKLDNTVVYWNQSYWSVVASGPGGAYTADAPVEINGSVISMQAASALRDGYTSVANFDLWTAKWGPSGNNATGGDFIGTTNAQPLLLKTNSALVGKITGDGYYNYIFTPTLLGVLTTGHDNFIAGQQPTINGAASWGLMSGYQPTIASGVLAGISLGRNTTVNYNYGMAVNSSSISNGQGAFAANNAQVNSFMGAGFGQNNEVSTDASTPTTTTAGNRIFFIGNGSSTSHRHNALTVLHGSDLLDGANPLFGFNTLTPASTLEVAGTVSFAYVSKTADYTGGVLDYTIHFTSGTCTFTLPTAVGCTGRIYIAKNTTGGNLTLATTSGQTIDGSAPGTVANGAAAQFQSTGANWIKIN